MFLVFPWCVSIVKFGWETGQVHFLLEPSTVVWEYRIEMSWRGKSPLYLHIMQYVTYLCFSKYRSPHPFCKTLHSSRFMWSTFFMLTFFLLYWTFSDWFYDMSRSLSVLSLFFYLLLGSQKLAIWRCNFCVVPATTAYPHSWLLCPSLFLVDFKDLLAIIINCSAVLLSNVKTGIIVQTNSAWGC